MFMHNSKKNPADSGGVIVGLIMFPFLLGLLVFIAIIVWKIGL
jgi:hypothetical protein